MKLAILSESHADEAALEIIVGSILKRPLQLVQPPLRSRGWPSVRIVLPSVIKHLYYHTDAEALAVIVDSNDSTVHDPSHEETDGGNPGCRLCILRGLVRDTLSHLRAVEGKDLLKVAIGLAVPCIEAWYLCGKDPHVTEAAWVQARREGRYPYTCNDLKKVVYGTDRPSLPLETRRAREEAQRLCDKLDLLERSFPNGFGPFLSELRAW